MTSLSAVYPPMTKEEPEYRVVQKSAAVQAVLSVAVFAGGCFVATRTHLCQQYFIGRWMAWVGAVWFGASVVQFNVAYWTRRRNE
jgi:hypothetical protein